MTAASGGAPPRTPPEGPGPSGPPDDRAFVRARLSARRFAHCEGVSAEAVRLAARFGVDAPGLGRTGILHDLARELPDDELLRLALAPEAPAHPAGWRAHPILLHGAAAVTLIRRHLAPLPPALERAVVHHAVGDPTLAPESLLLMIADLTEPTRGYPSAPRMRTLVAEAPDLPAAARAVLAAKFAHHRAQGYADAPETAAMLAALERAPSRDAPRF